MANPMDCIKGMAQLDAAFHALPERIAKNTLRGAVSAGAAVIRKEAILRAPIYQFFPLAHPDERVDPGLLKRAIYQAHVPEKSNATTQTFIVSVRSGPGQRAKKKGKRYVNMDAFYASWVEFGHWYVPPRPRGVTRKAHRRKFATPPGLFVPAHPFMRPAVQAKQKEAVAAIEKYLRERIPQELGKLGVNDTAFETFLRASMPTGT